MTALWRFLLILMIVLPLGLALAPFTERGSQSLLTLVDRYTPLDIDYLDGTIAGQLRLESLTFSADAVRIQVSKLRAQLDLGCLWRSTICFRELKLGDLLIDLVPGTDAEQLPAAQVDIETEADSPVADDSPLIVFPVPVETGALSIDATHVLWQNGSWRQGAAQLGVRIRDSSVEIFDAVVGGAVLELLDSDAAVESPRIVLSAIDLPLVLSVDGLTLERPAWNAYGGEHQLQNLSLRGAWRNTQLRIEELIAVDPQWGALSLHGDLTFADDWPMQLSCDATLAEPPVWQGLHARSVKAAASGSLSALSVQLTSPGVPQLVAEAQLDVLDRGLPFESSIQLLLPSGWRVGELVGSPAALAELVIEAPVELKVSGALETQQFQLHTSASGLGYQSLAVSASGSVAQNKLALSQFLLRDTATDSELLGSGNVAMDDPLAVSVEINSSGFNLPQLGDFPHGRLQGSARAGVRVHPNSWQLQLQEVAIEGMVNGLPATINGHGGISSDWIPSSSDLVAELNGTRLKLQAPGGKARPASFELVLDDLGRWQPGSLGRAGLEGTYAVDTRRWQFQGRLHDVRWQALHIEDGELSGDYRLDTSVPSQLDLLLTNLLVGEVALDTLRLNARGSAARHRFSLLSQGDLSGELAVTGTLDNQRWDASLAATTLQTAQGSWRLSQPVSLGWSAASGTATLAGHCWRQERTRICPGEWVLGPDTKGALTIDGELGFLAALLPPEVEISGELQLRLDAAWNSDSGLTFEGESHTRAVQLVREIGEGEAARLSWDSGAANVAYGRDGLQLNWEARRDGRRVLALELLLPPERDAKLVGSLQIQELRLASAAPLLPELSTLEGTLSGRLEIGGTVDQPQAFGSLNLSGGRVAVVGNPTELRSLDLVLALQGDKGSLSGSGDLGGGELQLTGELSVRPQWRMTLSLAGKEHTVLYPPATQLLLSQELVLSASGGRLDIAGEITVHEGVLQADDLPEGAVAVSSDIVEVDYAGNVISKQLPFDLSMDLLIRLRDRFKVKGALIDATLGGELRLLQKPRRPLQMFGSLNVVGGEVRAYQQSLRITRGSASFTGRPDNPLVNVRALRTIANDNVKVGVEVQGTLDEMRLEVFSDPVMSQGEAMSYLVRGRGLDASTGADGAALALSLASTVVNRSTIVSELNRIPGISDLSFGAEGSEDDTAATVSGFIGNRIYLSYGVGVYEPINVLTARFYLRTRLWLEVVSRLENSVDLYYSFDID